MMRSLWMDPSDLRYPPLSDWLDVDIAIIGAGFSGLGAAFALRDTGLRICVLEGRRVSSGASGRNAGFVLAGPAMSFFDCCSAIGTAGAVEIWELTRENHRLIAEVIDCLRIDCGYLRRGSMSLAASPEELAGLVESHRKLADAGVSTCILGRRELPVPFDRMYEGGLYYPGNAEIEPGAFLDAVAAEIRSSVQILENTCVASIERGDIWKLHTARGIVSAGAVLLATNAWTSRLLPDVPIAPVRGQVLSTAPLDRVVVPFPMYADRGYQYWRQTAAGRLVAGGWRDRDIAGEVGLEEKLHPQIQGLLEAFCEDVVGIAPRIEQRWAGTMGFTPDMFPLVGRLPGVPDAHIAAGYSGHGVSMAFLCGALAARHAAGESVSIPAPFAPDRVFGRDRGNLSAPATT